MNLFQFWRHQARLQIALGLLNLRKDPRAGDAAASRQKPRFARVPHIVAIEESRLPSVYASRSPPNCAASARFSSRYVKTHRTMTPPRATINSLSMLHFPELARGQD